MVDAAIGGALGLDAAVVRATRALLRSLRRSIRWRLMLLLRGFRLLVLLRLLLMLLLCGFRLLVLLPLLPLLMLLPLLRFALLLTLLLVLCVGRGSGSKKREQNCCADDDSSFHLSVLLLSARGLSTLSPASSC
jgi:hypothetical protein